MPPAITVWSTCTLIFPTKQMTPFLPGVDCTQSQQAQSPWIRRIFNSLPRKFRHSSASFWILSFFSDFFPFATLAVIIASDILTISVYVRLWHVNPERSMSYWMLNTGRHKQSFCKEMCGGVGWAPCGVCKENSTHSDVKVEVLSQYIEKSRKADPDTSIHLQTLYIMRYNIMRPSPLSERFWLDSNHNMKTHEPCGRPSHSFHSCFYCMPPCLLWIGNVLMMATELPKQFFFYWRPLNIILCAIP